MAENDLKATKTGTAIQSSLERQVDALFIELYKNAKHIDMFAWEGNGTFPADDIRALFANYVTRRMEEPLKKFSALAAENPEQAPWINAIGSAISEFSIQHSAQMAESYTLLGEHSASELKMQAHNNPLVAMRLLEESMNRIAKMLPSPTEQEIAALQASILNDMQEKNTEQSEQMMRIIAHRKPRAEQTQRNHETLQQLAAQGLAPKAYYLRATSSSMKELLACYANNPKARPLIQRKWQEITSADDTLQLVTAYNPHAQEQTCIEMTEAGCRNLDQHIHDYMLREELSHITWSYDAATKHYNGKIDEWSDTLFDLCRADRDVPAEEKAALLSDNFYHNGGSGIGNCTTSGAFKAWNAITHAPFSSVLDDTGHRWKFDLSIDEAHFKQMQAEGMNLIEHYPLQITEGANWLRNNARSGEIEATSPMEAKEMHYRIGTNTQGAPMDNHFTFNTDDMIVDALQNMDVAQQSIMLSRIDELKSEILKRGPTIRIGRELSSFMGSLGDVVAETDPEAFAKAFTARATLYADSYRAMANVLEENIAHVTGSYTPHNVVEAREGAARFDYLAQLVQTLPAKGLQEMVRQGYTHRITDYYDKFERGSGQTNQIEYEFHSNIALQPAKRRGKPSYSFTHYTGDLKYWGGEEGFARWIKEDLFTEQMKASGFGEKVRNGTEPPFHAETHTNDRNMTYTTFWLNEEVVQAMALRGLLQKSTLPISPSVMKAELGEQWKAVFEHDNILNMLLKTSLHRTESVFEGVNQTAREI